MWLVVEEVFHFVATVTCSNLFSREHPTFLLLAHSHTLLDKLASQHAVLANC